MLNPILVSTVIAIFCALSLIRRQKSKPLGNVLLAASLSLAVVAGGYSVGKDLARRDSLAQSSPPVGQI